MASGFRRIKDPSVPGWNHVRLPDGRLTARITCPNGHYDVLAPERIQVGGRVLGGFLCCTNKRVIKLHGWMAEVGSLSP